ncbi:type II CRISPR RNA-guided endonuclease Cas9 [Sulfurimonas sp. SWIR-19]|uniref:type II CRISPR RNA-guided endonuclease Cas9 n=1 Tax=Sulfurimonas sp. SWIR-19 TaxID=2878390 RepID=UPI001CF4E7F0|nr:type II CRISPR RNA-guided endonuclease Cas9 [Sulfurimonas sp. SWIR-19]UCN00341.1 type II CRISPR RNA-guided endonuclease Cas9 [Sulfurimonas sp. SWIR-19]
MKQILSLDLGITSVGYSVIQEHETDKYSLVDYGVSMFDKPTDKDGNSKKLLHSQALSAKKLHKLRKQRKQKLASLFEKYNLGNRQELLEQEKNNIYKNKWELRGKTVFEKKLSIGEIFTILYHIAKHRGYKSLDSGDLLEELCDSLGIETEASKSKKDDERGQIKQALKNIEALREKYSQKTVAQIIYELENKKENPIFRNHDNYNYMIRREYINDEIRKIIKVQDGFDAFDNLDSGAFANDVVAVIDDQKESTNDLSLFGKCEYYSEYYVAHQYSLLSDIFKMYQAVANITFNKEKIKITKEQIALVAQDFLDKVKNAKSVKDIKYKDIRKILKLDDNVKIFNKDDSYLSRGKTHENSIVKFHFVDTLSKIDKSFVKDIFSSDESYALMREIFDVLHYEKSPKLIYEQLKNKISNEQVIIELIRNKKGNSLNISSFAMLQLLPYFEEGLTLDEIKQKLGLQRQEDYAEYKKGIKYLHITSYEKDDDLEINNHPVKYAVSAALRVVKYLHSKYGAFDEIKVESTRELSLNEKAKKEIEKANRAFEKEIQQIVENTEYQKIAQSYGKNLHKYARKILMWEEQERFDIYSGKSIGITDIFSNSVDIDHIVPQSLGGLSVKHNFVLVHRDENLQKSNQLPMNYVADKETYKNRVEHLFHEHKINWKKRKNLLANNLDEIYKDTFESKSLRATSYIEALTAQVLKRYYPFQDVKKLKDGSAVRHLQGRATSNIRKVLGVKTKNRETNIHHAIDAILIGVTNHSWLQKLSNTFRENFGRINDEARKNIKKVLPYMDGLEIKDLVKEIESQYNSFGEDSIFYKDIWGKVKTVNFWVSKKPMSSKVHKDTIYAKKDDGIYTVRENIIAKFIGLKVTPMTSPEEFIKKFHKDILQKMYSFKTNSHDIICKIVEQRAEEIKELLWNFEFLDVKNKEQMSEAKTKLELLIHKALVDNNGNIIRKVKFYQTNLTGFNVRGGLATKEKTFIGFRAYKKGEKLEYNRIDVANLEKIQKSNDGSFKAYKNDVVFFVYNNGIFRGGRIVSYIKKSSGSKLCAFLNPRFPTASEYQPSSFCKIEKGKHSGAKQQSIGSARGIIKLNLDILGNIKSYQILGNAESEILNEIKSIVSQ